MTAHVSLSAMQLETLNQDLEQASPLDIVGWAWGTFGATLAASSSFQTQSVPLLHMIAQAASGMTIYFLDTGFHFPETLIFRDQLAGRFGLYVETVTPAMGHTEFRLEYGDLYRRDPDMCCYINKVEPMRAVTARVGAWISGIRRDQTEHRKSTPIISVQKNGAYKICPLANWTQHDVWRYINRNDLPVHPLFHQGYLSVGCAPCTRSVGDGEDERAGRWDGANKTECGLHTLLAEDAAQRYIDQQAGAT